MSFVRKALATLLLSALPAAAAQAAPAPKRPNFLVIVADDMGYSDIGAFGGEIDTPNLDKLALSGLRLTEFHTAPACSPTRAMLLTGSDSHRVGLGAMAEITQANQRGVPGFEGYLRADAPTIAERLGAAGYRTLFAGKWHLGMKPEQDPHARGFQHSFSLPAGGSNYFGVDFRAGTTLYREDGAAVKRLPDDFYSTDYFGDKLAAQIRSTKAGPDGKKPFFAYLAFTAPHFPLQAPADTIAKYKGRYDTGFEALRQQRLKRQVELGLLNSAALAHPLVGLVTWDSLTPEQKRISAHDMEIYAAMVDRIDGAVGRVIAALKETGEYENTIILFLSDNGAEGKDVNTSKNEQVRKMAAEGGGDLATRGSGQSYISYGPGWAQAATAPSWLYKTFATEGGTRSVAFITGPVVRQPGQITKIYTHVTDVVPTFLDIAGVKTQADSFAGQATQPIDGLSWKAFLNDGKPVYAADKAVGNELFGSRSIRRGDWKISDLSDGTWHLFNVAADPGETQDLSDKEPERKAELVKAWEDYAARVGVTLPNPPFHPDPLMAGKAYSSGAALK